MSRMSRPASAQDQLVPDRDPSVPPWPRRYSVSWRMDGALYDRLSAAGKANGLAFEQLMEQAAAEWLAERDP